MANLEITKIIDEICELSKNEAGEIARLPFSDPWVRGGAYLKEFFERLGFDTFYDSAGNLHGRIGAAGDTVLTGSHADTVKNGGKYDGLYGVVASALAASRLYKKHGAPKTAIEVVAFSEEEGSRFPFNFFGSKALAGDLSWETVREFVDKEGISFAEAMESKGFSYKEEGVKRDDIKAFVEIHIEQGGVLEANQKEAGVVTAIVGQRKYIVEIFGEANHAGTTPMAYRKDAGLSASVIVSKIIKRAKEYGDPMVATVGQIEFKPGNINVVPAYARFSLDLRHTENEELDRIYAEFLEIVQRVTADTGTSYEIQTIGDSLPVYMDKGIMDIIEGICKERQIPHMKLPSGAGHDAQIVAQLAPVGMIFVPSKGGISHNPQEFTEASQLEAGVGILEEVLYRLAY